MKNKKGISLIVLIITIIVLVILAGVVIINLSNEDTISDASYAVGITNEKTAQQIAEVKWAHIYSNPHKIPAGKTFEEAVVDAIKAEGISTEKFEITVTKEGVTVKDKNNLWKKEGFKVVRKGDVLEIGDTINYDAGIAGYTGGWKVLGADKDGNLLIMSAADIETKTLGGSAVTAQKAQEDWLTAVTELNKLCEPYGKGSGALGARSITAEDVNTVTGYDPEAKKYGKNQVYEYGTEASLSWSGTKIAYTISNGKSGTGDGHSKGFNYYNESEDKFVNIPVGNALPTIKNGYYDYDISTLSIKNNSKAYSMICGISGNWNQYWLASRFAYLPTIGFIYYGVRRVEGLGFNYTLLYTSQNYTNTNGVFTNGVRAVVTLDAGIRLTGSSSAGWSYTAN